MTQRRSRYLTEPTFSYRPIRVRMSPVVFMLLLGSIYLWWVFSGKQRAIETRANWGKPAATASAQAAAPPEAVVAPPPVATPSPAPMPSAAPAAPATSPAPDVEPSELVREAYSALGTLIDVQVVAPPSKDPKAMLAGVREVMAHVENLYSPNVPTSFVSRLNALAGGEPLKVPPEEAEVFDELDAARRMSELTGGAFDITFESAGRFWRFEPENPRLPSQEELRGAAAKIDYRRVIVDRAAGTVRLEGKDTRIGLGGIAKGVAIDRAIAYLKKQGATAALVNIGGDCYGYGLKPNGQGWVVGMQHPRHRREMLGGVRFPLDESGVFTSGDYERMFIIDGKRYSHIFDPRTGMPATGVASVTLLMRPPQYGLSLSIFVLGPEKGIELVRKLRRQGVQIEAIVVTDRGEIVTTDGVPEALRKMRVDMTETEEPPTGPEPERIYVRLPPPPK